MIIPYITNRSVRCVLRIISIRKMNSLIIIIHVSNILGGSVIFIAAIRMFSGDTIGCGIVKLVDMFYNQKTTSIIVQPIGLLSYLCSFLRNISSVHSANGLQIIVKLFLEGMRVCVITTPRTVKSIVGWL